MELSNLSDEEIVLIVRETNQEAYAEIVRRYQIKLAHYLRKFFSNQDQLEDVLQEVFIKAFRNLFAFNANKRFSPWIYRIAHNEAVNHLKKYAKEVFYLDQEEMQIVDDKIKINEEMDTQMIRREIERGLAVIRPKYREPLILYYFEQKTYEEISEILRLPISTVGVLIMRAKKLLQQKLTRK